jgi:ribosomal protein S20
MTKNDQELMAEAYQQVQEGMFDRVKARASQLGGAVKGVKDRVKGAAKGAAGKAVSAAGTGLQKAADVVWDDAPEENKLISKGQEIQKAGAADTSAGKAGGQEAKFRSYIKNSANTIANDLSKLGMEVDDTEALVDEIQSVVSKHLTQVTKGGLYKRGGGDRRGTKVGATS